VKAKTKDFEILTFPNWKNCEMFANLANLVLAVQFTLSMSFGS
jgi:hypothetical protein